MKMVQYPASDSLPTLTNELCCKPGRMSRSLAIGLRVVSGRSALKDVLKVCPFGTPYLDIPEGCVLFAPGNS